MYYRSGTVGRCCCVCSALTRRQHFCVKWRPPRLNYVVISETYQKCDSVSGVNRCIYFKLKNNRDKFQPGLIWNDGAWGLFWRGRPKKKNKNKMS